MTRVQRASIEGFLAGYDRSAAPPLTILTPNGTVNAVAASYAASDFAKLAQAEGVPGSRIVLTSYQVDSIEEPAKGSMR